MEPKPPRWAHKLLQCYCDASLLEEVEGDLYELFYQRIRTRGLRQARFLYGWDVLYGVPQRLDNLVKKLS